MKKRARQARQKRWRKSGFAGVGIAVERDSTAATDYWQDEAPSALEAPLDGAAKTNPGCWIQPGLVLFFHSTRIVAEGGLLIASGTEPSASGDHQNLTAMMRLKPPRSATVHISTFLSERQQSNSGSRETNVLATLKWGLSAEFDSYFAGGIGIGSKLRVSS